MSSTLAAFDLTEQKDQPLRYCRVICYEANAPCGDTDQVRIPHDHTTRPRIPSRLARIGAGQLCRRERDAKPGLATHHVLVARGRALQRKDLGHRAHTVGALKASVSCESIDVPDASP